MIASPAYYFKNPSKMKKPVHCLFIILIIAQGQLFSPYSHAQQSGPVKDTVPGTNRYVLKARPDFNYQKNDSSAIIKKRYAQSMGKIQEAIDRKNKR
jgi:hypothetical protein